MLDKIQTLLSLSLIIVLQLTVAQNKEPVFVESNSATYDQNAGIITYTKNVKLNQGTTHLTANLLISHLDQSRKLSKATANGTPKTPAHYWDTKANNKSEVHAYADTIEYLPNQETGVITCTKNVKLHQGTTHLAADFLISHLDQNRKLSKATANGTAKTQAHYWDTKANNKPEFHAYADTIEYLPNQDKIILIGHASLLQNNDSYQAQKIEYNTVTKQVYSPSLPNKKVTFIFEVK